MEYSLALTQLRVRLPWVLLEIIPTHSHLEVGQALHLHLRRHVRQKPLATLTSLNSPSGASGEEVGEEEAGVPVPPSRPRATRWQSARKGEVLRALADGEEGDRDARGGERDRPCEVLSADERLRRVANVPVLPAVQPRIVDDKRKLLRLLGVGFRQRGNRVAKGRREKHQITAPVQPDEGNRGIGVEDVRSCPRSRKVDTGDEEALDGGAFRLALSVCRWTVISCSLRDRGCTVSSARLAYS